MSASIRGFLNLPCLITLSLVLKPCEQERKYICAKGKTQRKPAESLKVRCAFNGCPRLTPSRFAFAPVKARKSFKGTRTVLRCATTKGYLTSKGYCTSPKLIQISLSKLVQVWPLKLIRVSPSKLIRVSPPKFIRVSPSKLIRVITKAYPT
ncbi:hypothetical protein BDD12DRAFT_853258 [Trichophaea hybrida]|nr:hypothetical protein BDD12DRAFT_853258 [Trichophaea hybrida]